MLPKTLFGEKFVDLVAPKDGTDDPIEDGDVIPQDRSETARETEKALNDLLPLLQALRPQDVSTTLNAVSTALRGRGDRIGENLELVDSYLKELNPAVPTIGEDFRGLADLADTLTQTAPDLLPLLDDLSAVNRNLVDEEQQLSTFLRSTTGASGELEDFLSENEQRLVRLAADSLPPLQVFARVRPGVPVPRQGPRRLRQDHRRHLRRAAARPAHHAGVRAGPGRLRAGDRRAALPRRPRTGLLRPACPEGPGQGHQLPGRLQRLGRPRLHPARRRRLGVRRAGPRPRPWRRRPSSARLMSSVLAPVLGVASDDVPDLAYLLFGPVARGTEVGLR